MKGALEVAWLFLILQNTQGRFPHWKCIAKHDLTEQIQACLHRDKNKYLEDGTAAFVLLNIPTI